MPIKRDIGTPSHDIGDHQPPLHRSDGFHARREGAITSGMTEIEIIEGRQSSPVLLLCDHAGHRVPGGIHFLGIGEEQLRRHIGWDIGAADVTRRLAARFGAAAILDHCSRLVIDPNRRPGSPTSIPPVSDGCVIPGNGNLSAPEVSRRIREYFLPYHRTVARRVGAMRRAGIVPVVIAVHSFTPRMNGLDRPWHVGVLWRGDTRLSAPVLERLHARGELIVGDNQPYSGLHEMGFTMAFHGQRTGLPHLMLEIRNDLIADPGGAGHWAGVVGDVLQPSLDDSSPKSLYSVSNDEITGMRKSWRHASLFSPSESRRNI